MNLDITKIAYPQFQVTQMTGTGAKVLTNLKLKQTNRQTIPKNETQSLSSLVSFSFSQPCSNASFPYAFGGKNE